MEDSFVPESPSVRDRATSDDTYVPPTQRVTTPAPACPVDEPHYHIGESSCRPRLVRAPRKCIRDLPTGVLAPRGKAPMTDTEEPRQRHYPHLAWMPDTLRQWRALEDIPTTVEIGEPSRPLPITGEPLELTVVTLVAMVRALYGLHHNTRYFIRGLRRDTTRLDGDVMTMFGRLSTAETHVDVDRESADATRARVAVLESRARVVGIVVGVCLMLAVMATAMWFYLSYLR